MQDGVDPLVSQQRARDCVRSFIEPTTRRAPSRTDAAWPVDRSSKTMTAWPGGDERLDLVDPT